MNYAMVENGVVTNVIWLNPCNACEFEGVYPVGDMPVAIGDVFDDGKYYRNGLQIQAPTLTDTEKLKTRADAVESAVDWLITTLLGGM